jgi:hypothetical protein
MNRLPPVPKRSDASGMAWQRLGRALRRLHGLAYAAVAAGAMAAAGLQPPHTAAVEVGTVMVATAAAGELAWSSTASPASR